VRAESTDLQATRGVLAWARRAALGAWLARAPCAPRRPDDDERGPPPAPAPPAGGFWYQICAAAGARAPQPVSGVAALELVTSSVVDVDAGGGAVAGAGAFAGMEPCDAAALAVIYVALLAARGADGADGAVDAAAHTRQHAIALAGAAAGGIPAAAAMRLYACWLLDFAPAGDARGAVVHAALSVIGARGSPPPSGAMAAGLLAKLIKMAAGGGDVVAPDGFAIVLQQTSELLLPCLAPADLVRDGDPRVRAPRCSL
jgi:hypothetical protein